MTRWALFFFVLFSSLVISDLIPPVQAKPPAEVAIKRQQLRNEYIRFESIIDSLDITEGMTILDIGAGPGYASFIFARQLQGSGEVYATDIREDFIDYITEEAKRQGLANLYAAVVQPNGLDDFYERHRYDIVLLSNVYHVIENRVDYFTKLRQLLNPAARLVLVLYNQAPLFSVDDLVDVYEIGNILAMSDNDPFWQKLSSETKQYIKDREHLEKFKNFLIDDFNRMLTDPHFYENFYNGSYFNKKIFSAPERDLANWLLMTIKEEGILAKSVDQIDARQMRAVIKLNRLFFQSRFGKHLANGGSGAYIPAGDANRHTSKYEMIRELYAAGYKLSGEIKVSTYFDAVIMTPVLP